MDTKKIAFFDKIKTEPERFVIKLQGIADFLRTDINWLMSVMYAESKLNSKAINPISNAVGLIQFMPATLNKMGYTTEQVKNMSALDQLDLVKQYFQPFKGRLKSYFDVYLAVFFPAAIGKPDNWIFQAKNLSASIIARQNKIIDWNSDDKITVAEFKEYLKNTIPVQLHKLIFAIKNNSTTLLILLFAGFLFVNK